MRRPLARSLVGRFTPHDTGADRHAVPRAAMTMPSRMDLTHRRRQLATLNKKDQT
jgi:hypothetical protein